MAKSNRGSKASKRVPASQRPTAEQMSKKDVDILVLSPSEVVKKYGATRSSIHSRKNVLWNKFGKNFIPAGAVKGEEYNGPSADSPDVVTENQPGFKAMRKTASRRTTPQRRPLNNTTTDVLIPRVTRTGNGVMVEYGDIRVSLPQMPKSIRINPATNTLDLD